MSAAAPAPLADLQKIAVKVPLTLPPGAVDGFVPLLDRWRLADGGDWVDVVDNAHLASGVVVQLVGRRFTVGVDIDAPAGWVHLGKRGLEGTPVERVRAVVRAALGEAARLTADAARPPGVEVRLDALWIGVNDRVDWPNAEETEAALGPLFAAAADLLYGAGGWSRTRDPDPRARFGWWIRPATPPASLESLRARL